MSQSVWTETTPVPQMYVKQKLNVSPFCVAVSLEGSKTMEGFLVLAIPSANQNAQPVGSFSIARDLSGTAISQPRCEMVRSCVIVILIVK